MSRPQIWYRIAETATSLGLRRVDASLETYFLMDSEWMIQSSAGYPLSMLRLTDDECLMATRMVIVNDVIHDGKQDAIAPLDIKLYHLKETYVNGLDNIVGRIRKRLEQLMGQVRYLEQKLEARQIYRSAQTLLNTLEESLNHDP